MPVFRELIFPDFVACEHIVEVQKQTGGKKAYPSLEGSKGSSLFITA